MPEFAFSRLKSEHFLQIHQSMSDSTTTPNRNTQKWIGILFLALVLGLGVLYFTTASTAPPPQEQSAYLKPGQWIPESERSGHRRVIGLDPHRASYFMLPTLNGPAGADPKTYRDIQRQLYWLNFRFSHGRILSKFQKDTELYVAVPDSKSVTESLGGERDFFTEYLHDYNGWSNLEIRRRIRFFPTTFPLIWTQDAGEMMIRPEDKIATIYRGTSDYFGYLDFLKSLVQAYPDVFTVKELPSEFSGEGGDLEVVWGPDHQPALLLGRHRVLQYMKETRGKWDPQKPLTRAQIEEARAAFSKSYEGLPVYIVPEQALLEPSKGNNELFHLDMLVSIMDNHRNDRPDAFVAEFSSGPILDAMSGKPLSPGFVAKCRWEYEQTALQLRKIGYDVYRLPFNDHPVRSPVNFGKFRDLATGKYMVMLAKFPAHIPDGKDPTAQTLLQYAVAQLDEDGKNWQEKGTEESLDIFQDSLRNIWRVMDEVESMPNPRFEARAKVFRDAGYEVIEVPCYSWGAGGIHCQILK